MMRRRAGDSADELVLMTSSTQEDKSIIVEEDSGEAFDEPDASNSSIQSKSLYESAVAKSFSRSEFQAQRIEEVAKLSSRSDVSAANQLTTYILGTKKTISSSYICPADGSQYKQSAVGLVFMESAVGLAMETSKVESAVRNQARAMNESTADEEKQKMMRRRAGDSADGLVVDDVIGDVIIFSRWFASAVARISRCYLEIAIAKRCRLHKLIRQRFALALKIQQMLFAMKTSSRKKPAGSYSTSRRELQHYIEPVEDA
ncbi:hypothetical protein F511_12037 [Dorcoceras hygrometricum]|uniref:Uncharacterized protein n=1 Tax=Dorcoceras hygrometricum TaxID=472368 RepID=A0A2Z7C4A3_9LAMI|nr:hypothetical protein F511_12037 [Dorcoceras hygrometricum]